MDKKAPTRLSTADSSTADFGFRAPVAIDVANLVEPLLCAARVEATLGEMCAALRQVFGSYVEPARF